MIELTGLGRVLAFDWGAARIGVAASDTTRTLASPRKAIVEKDKGRQIHLAAATVAEAEAVLVLVGLPVHLDGTPGASARSATMFAEKLRGVLEAGKTGTPPAVVLVDERFTSKTAEQHLMTTRSSLKNRRDGALDSASAAVLLQSWLDSQSNRLSLL